MTSVLDARQGVQHPRVSSVPVYSSSSGVEACELAASVGVFLDPWQQLFITDCLGERTDGKWAAREAGLLVARQNGKGEILLALGLAGLFLLDEKLILHSAHEFKTAAEAFLRIKTVIDGSDDLRRQIRTIRTSHGDEGIELTNGQRLRFVARSKSSGRGFTGDRNLLDEAQQLPARAVRALIPTIRARPNPQIVYTGTVPGPENDSEHWRSIRDRGRLGTDARMLWHEYSPPGAEVGEVDPDDRDGWYWSNPALGIRVSEEDMAAERETFRADPDGFLRELESVWPGDSGTSEFRGWANLSDMAERGATPCFGVAVAPDRSWSAVAAAWRRPDGLVQIALTEHGYRPDATWIREHVDGLRTRAPGCEVWADQAARGLVPGAEEPSQAEQAQADNALADAVLAGMIRHADDPALNTAVRSAKWKSSGDTRVLDRKGLKDISPLRAAALALWGLGLVPPGDPGVYVF